MIHRVAVALLSVAFAACSSSKTNATGAGSGGSVGHTASSAGSGGKAAGASSSAASTGSGSTTGTGGAACMGGAAGAGGGSGWALVWADEFDGPDGSGVDATKWTALVGGDGWGNQEREYYTADVANAQQMGGNLVITATTAGASQYSCWYGQCLYTSARLQTMGHFQQAYGRFEARIKIPQGQGLWPAFWMLGDDINAVSWPQCGEIDVMENIGKEPGTVHGSMHGPGYSGGNALTGSFTLPGGAMFADDFHVFAVDWEPGVVRFYVDAMLYETRMQADVPVGGTWVFDQPFFVLLNVAVGGGWPGDPDATTMWPQTMLVDYVRVYGRC